MYNKDMDTLVSVLFYNSPAWVSVLTFALGWCAGWFFRGIHDGTKNSRVLRLESIMQTCVVFIWIIATARAALFDAPYPPLFVNLIFGAVAGSLNKELGTSIVNFAKELRK